MKRMTWWGLGVLTLGAIAVVGYLRIDADAAAPRLTTSRVTKGAIVQTVSSTGTLQPVDTVEVGTQVSGTIKTLGADFNSTVKKGQVVATLDPALFASQVEQAQAAVVKLRADVEQARVNVKDTQQKLARAKALSAQQLLAQSDYDIAQTAADAAQAALKSVEAQAGQADASLRQNQVNLSHTIITSPVDGIVLNRAVEIGQTVSASTQAPTLFTIARNLATMQVNASVDEADIGQVQPGQPVKFTVDAYGTDLFTGTVRQVRLQPITTNNVVNYTTVIDVPNAELKLKPGMTATVNIEVARVEDVTRVPAAALRFQPTEDVLIALNGPDAVTMLNANHTRGTRGANGGDGSRTGSRRNSANGSNVANASNAASGVNAASSANTSAANANAATGTASRTSASSAATAPTGQKMATIWQVVDGRLKPLRVATGLSDGTHVAVSSPNLDANAEVVTGLVSASSASNGSKAPTGGSPLMPSMPRRPGGGRG
jgi:HlyD family secretion protein